MGNCTSNEDMMKGRAVDAKTVEVARPVKGQLQGMFDEKKGEGISAEVFPMLAHSASDSVCYASGEAAPPLTPREVVGDTIVGAAAEAVGDAADSADRPESVRHPGIAALRLSSPSHRVRGLSLLRAAGARAAEPEAQSGAGADAAVDAQEVEEVEEVEEAVDAVVDAVAAADAAGETGKDKGRPSELLIPDAAPHDEPGAPECESPLSPASWAPDASTKVCQCCEANFTLLRRRHHCRACGNVVCSSCSPSRRVVPEMECSTPVRCCDKCVEAERSVDAIAK